MLIRHSLTAIILIFTLFFNPYSLATEDDFENFITRSGSMLLDGKEEFRFAGIHAPELHRIERDSKGTCKKDPRGWGQYFKWPTSVEQENWIKALTKSGTKAMRIYVLSVEDPSDALCQRETHILKPITPDGEPRLDEKAFIVFDQMIAHAKTNKLRLIIPFIDHWEWWGGRKQLAAFYQEKPEDFYNVNSRTYKAYQTIIKSVLTRVNTITGQRYSEEKTIMAWETGNELKHTNEAFLIQTAALIKSLAPKQLVIDGTYLSINEYAILDPNVDIISNHFYTVNNNNKPETITSDLKKIDARKAYMVGEFGLSDVENIDAVMQAAVHTSHKGAKAVGAFVWSFRGHREGGGFYWHADRDHFSYHLPGFKEGDHNNEIDVVDLVRKAQAQMNGLEKALPLPKPEPPILWKIESRQNIRWLGSPLGRAYDIQRSKNISGPWQPIGHDISDGMNKFNPETDTLFSDNSDIEKGTVYYYRIIGKNEGGNSTPSNVEAFKAK